MNFELSDRLRNAKCAVWLTLMLAGAVVSVRAQVGGMVGQTENANTREQLNQTAESQLAGSNSVPQLYEGETSDVGPQSVVAPRERRALFQARADMQFLYTDNVFLTDHNKVGSGVMISTAEIALAPTPYPLGSGTLAPEIGYEGQFFDYFFNKSVQFIGNAELFPRKAINDFDFNSQSVFGDATWTCGHMSFGGGVEATRMFNTARFDPFYDELAPNWYARYVLPFGEKSALSATYLGDYRFTSSQRNFFSDSPGGDINDRMDHSLLLAWTQVLTKQLVFQPFYEFKYTRFAQQQNTFTINPTTFAEVFATRNDYLNTVGAGVYWLVCPNCIVRGFVNYNNLKSSISAVEYREYDAGGGVDVSFRF